MIQFTCYLLFRNVASTFTEVSMSFTEVINTTNKVQNIVQVGIQIIKRPNAGVGPRWQNQPLTLNFKWT